MPQPQVIILEKEPTVGEWLLQHLMQIGVAARWVPTVADLLSESETAAPVICLVGLRPPVAQALALIADLTQEPRFAQTSFILMGPLQYKHAAFEAGADDYLITPPDVIELRKRVRLYLDRASLEARVVAETRITQEMTNLGETLSGGDNAGPMDEESITLLEHAAALAAERDLLEHMLHHIPFPVAMVTPQGLTRATNPIWESTFGATPPNSRLSIGWPPATTDDDVTRALTQTIDAAQAWHGEVSLALSATQARYFTLAITPVLDAAGDLDSFVLICVPVEEQKALDEVKARFISDAANEMRTPVTNIKMRHYLLKEAPEAQRATHLQAMELETERLQRLVDALLELSRMDTGLVQMTYAPVNLTRLVDEALIRYAPGADARQITLRRGPEVTLPPVSADAKQLARALGIVIENALNHTPAGGRVEVHLGEESWSGGTYATLQVRDTGMGIAKDALPHVFDRFFRSDRARDAGIRGVGLGLAIAQEIIARHQGTITVESVLDRGSMFTIWLPLS